MAIYEGICSGDNSIESTWALMGLACKLAQSVSIYSIILKEHALPGFFFGGVGWSTYVEILFIDDRLFTFACFFFW
jgi:hypothetical protein